MADRVWQIGLPAPTQFWSANDAHRAGPHKTSSVRKAWRTAAYQAAQAHHLPRGLARVRFAITFHFTTHARRDALNYADTAKPIIDAFGPPFVQKPTPKKPKGSSAPGYCLIPDDTPEYLESTTLAIGPLWHDHPGAVDPGNKAGGVTITITELPALPGAATKPVPEIHQPGLFEGLR